MGATDYALIATLKNVNDNDEGMDSGSEYGSPAKKKRGMAMVKEEGDAVEGGIGGEDAKDGHADDET